LAFYSFAGAPVSPERQFCQSAVSFARAPVLPVMPERQFTSFSRVSVLPERQFARAPVLPECQFSRERQLPVLPERQYCLSTIFARAPVLPEMLERQFCQSGSLAVLQERRFLYNKKNFVYYLWRVLCFATRLIR
jgi:hypothetical protein